MIDFIDQNPVSAACFLVVAFCLFYTWMCKKDFFHPVVIYVFTQCLTLGIAYLKVVPQMTDFQPLTWCVWMGAMVSFAMGALTYYCLAPSQNSSMSVKKVLNLHLDSYSWKKHFICSIFLLLFFLCGVAGISFVAGGLIVFSSDPSHWVSPDIDYGYFPILESTAPLVTCYFVLASFKNLNPYRWIRNVSRVCAVLTPLIAFMCYPNRSTVLLCLGWSIIIYNYVKKRINVKYIVVAMVLVAVFFVFVAQFRSQYGANSIKGMTSRQIVLMPYKYIANNYWNLDYAINPPTDRTIHPFTMGIDALYGMFEYTRFPMAIRDMMGWDNMFNKSVQKVPGFNTTGYLWEVYKDWGVVGTVWFPFFVSFFMCYLYERMSRFATPRNIIFYSLFLYYIGWWWFVEGFKRGLFWLWIYMILFFCWFCSMDVRRKTDELPLITSGIGEEIEEKCELRF